MNIMEQFQIVKPEKISKDVSVREFLKIVKHNRSSIEHVVFVAPKLGSDNMGHFHVVIDNGTK